MTILPSWGSRIDSILGSDGLPKKPVISMAGDGSFVVIWSGEGSSSANGLWMQIYNADGTIRKPVTEILLESGDGNKFAPSVTLLNNGNFVVAWQDESGLDDDTLVGIRGQVYTSDGDKVGPDFHINSSLAGYQAEVSIAALANGGFAVSYTDFAGAEAGANGDGDGAGIRTRVFDDSGQALGAGEDPIANGVIAGSQSKPVTIALNNGRYVVLYQDDGRTEDPDNAIRGHIFGADGTRAEGDDFLVSSSPGSEEWFTAAALADGRFVVVWESKASSASNAVIKAQIFDADGNAIEDEIIVDPSGSEQQHEPQVVALKDGGFAISYWGFDGEEGIRIATFNASGGFVSQASVAGSEGYALVPSSRLGVLGDGRLVLTWSEGDLVSGEYAVRAQMFDPRGGGVSLPGTSQDDQYIGTAFNDVLSGADGNDRLTGAGGNDLLNGGAGTDTMIGGAGDDVYYMDAGDVVIEEGGGGYDTIIASYSAALGNNTQVEVLRAAAGTAPLSLGGGNMNDTLIGNDGRNVFNGGAGSDMLKGGRGDDVYYVDASDVVIEESGGGYDTIIAAHSAILGNDTQVEVLQAAAGVAPLNLGGANMNDTLIGNDGHNVINGGSGADRMAGQGGNDTYYVDHASDTVAEASAVGGDDHVFASVNFTLGTFVEKLTATSTLGLALSGNDLNNTIMGDAGRDTLRGDAGADTLAGGLGNDKLYGGAGKDVFVFDKAGHKSRNKDSILDWNSRDDTIRLDKAMFKKLSKGVLKSKHFTFGDKANDKDDYIGVNKKTGDVWYDPNGDKPGQQIVFANIGAKKPVGASDFFVI